MNHITLAQADQSAREFSQGRVRVIDDGGAWFLEIVGTNWRHALLSYQTTAGGVQKAVDEIVMAAAVRDREVELDTQQLQQARNHARNDPGGGH